MTRIDRRPRSSVRDANYEPSTCVKESRDWAILSMTDYNCFLEHTTWTRRAVDAIAACINRHTSTTFLIIFLIEISMRHASEYRKNDMSSDDSTLRNFWSRDRIRKRFSCSLNWTFSNRKLREKEKRSKSTLWRSRFTRWKRRLTNVFASIVYSFCIASRALARSRREKNDWKHCEKNQFTILAREKKMRNAASLQIKEFSLSMRRVSANDDHEFVKNNTWKNDVFNNRDSDSWWFEIWRRLIISLLDRWEHLISSSMRLSQIVKDIRKVLRARYRRSDDLKTSQRRRYAYWQHATMRIRNNFAMNLEFFKMRQQLWLSDKFASSSQSQIHDHRFQY
jgi:hypothetical protein